MAHKREPYIVLKDDPENLKYAVSELRLIIAGFSGANIFNDEYWDEAALAAFELSERVFRDILTIAERLEAADATPCEGRARESGAALD